MNKKITLYLLSASLLTLSEGYALFGFGSKSKKDDPKSKISKMVKEGFPSATFGSCTKTDGGVKFDVAIRHYQNSQNDPKLMQAYDREVNKKLDKLKECAKKKNPNFTKALAASCKMHAGIIPKEWTRSQALCEMVSGKQGAVEAKNEAINFMKQDYGSSKFACSKGYGKISWSGATEKFKKLSSDTSTQAVFDLYRQITDDHLEALSKCAIEKNKNFAAVLHESCTTDAPMKQWKSAVKLCKKAAKIMEVRGKAADAKAQAKVDGKLFPGMLAKIGCTKGVASPFDPAGLAEYMSRQGDIVGAKGATTPQAKQQAMKNGKRVLAYVDRLGKCAIKEGDVNFNKILSEKFGEADKHCKLPSLQKYQGTKVGSLLKKFHVLCKVTKKTSTAIGNTQDVKAAFNTLKVPSTLMAPAAYHICNEVMTEVWKDEDGIKAIKTILANEDALPRWQKHIAGIHSCISKNDKTTGVTKNPIMTSYIVSSANELKKLGNFNLETLADDAETIQLRKEEYDKQELEVNIDEDDVANMDDVAEAPESYDGEEEEAGVTETDADEEEAAPVEEEEEAAPEVEEVGDADEEAGTEEVGTEESDEDAAPVEEEGADLAQEDGGVFDGEEEEVEWID